MHSGIHDYVLLTELRMRFAAIWAEITDGVIHITKLTAEQRTAMEAAKSSVEEERCVDVPNARVPTRQTLVC